MSITIVALGEPAPQGSKSPKGINPATGRAVMVESSRKVAPWRGVLRRAAMDVVPATDRPHYGYRVPVRIEGWVIMHRPASVKPSARRYPVTTPDLDKVLRSIGDALTKVAYQDDSQVVEWDIKARYHDDPDVAHIAIEQGAHLVVSSL